MTAEQRFLDLNLITIAAWLPLVFLPGAVLARLTITLHSWRAGSQATAAYVVDKGRRLFTEGLSATLKLVAS